jgi:hypothetical protein
MEDPAKPNRSEASEATLITFEANICRFTLFAKRYAAPTAFIAIERKIRVRPARTFQFNKAVRA